MCTVFAYGQYYFIPASVNPNGNPGNLNTNVEEPYGNGLPGGWTVIDPLSVVPAWSTVQSLPFTFNFNGSPVTQYKVSNTGVLTFTTTASTVPGHANMTLPNTGIPDKSVCVWGLAYTNSSANDRIVSKTFGTSPNRQHWIQFNSYNKQTGASCWTYWSIVLEESSNNIYIVDQRSSSKNQCGLSLTLGVQVNSTSAVQIPGSPNLDALAGTSKTPVDNKHYTFIQGVAPTKDLATFWVQTSQYLIFNTAPFLLQGKVKNYTGTPVTSYDMNYSIDNGPPIKALMTGSGFNVAAYGEEWFIHDSMWTPPAMGIYNVKFWADNINGGADQNNSNDTLYKTIDVTNAFIPRVRLHEVFVSSTNADSKTANDSLKNVFDQHPGEYTAIKYPMDYPGNGDPYHTPECDDRKTFYGVDSIPDMIVNGTHIVDPMWYNANQFFTLEDRSYMSFTPTHTINGNTIQASVSIIPFQNFTNPNLKVRFAIVEKTTVNNVGTNGETQFYYVFKKFLPDANGTAIGQLQQAVIKTVTKSHTFSASNTIEDWSDLAVVVFVQDDDTKEILQSAWSTQTNSIEDNPAEKGYLEIFPNPTDGLLNINYMVQDQGVVTLEILDINGRVIEKIAGNHTVGIHSASCDLTGLEQGFYFIRFTNGNDIITKKLILQ